MNEKKMRIRKLEENMANILGLEQEEIRRREKEMKETVPMETTPANPWLDSILYGPQPQTRGGGGGGAGATTGSTLEQMITGVDPLSLFGPALTPSLTPSRQVETQGGSQYDGSKRKWRRGGEKKETVGDAMAHLGAPF